MISSIAEAITAMVERIVGPRLDYLAVYPAKLVQQIGDVVDVLCDDARIGHVRCRLLYGTPITSVTLKQGCRLHVGFEGGDPTKPWAGLWGEGDATLSFGGGSQGVARVGDAVFVTIGALELAQIALQLVCAAPGSPPGAVPAKPIVLAGSVAAGATKVRA